MRRPPVACRRAVQALHLSSPHHIWIPDELLDCAVNRFFRAIAPHQKRCGSHVPGPLEARRRATKRRISLATNFSPQTTFPPLFSLGALFGFHKDAPPLWSYKPPSLPKDVKVPEPCMFVRNLSCNFLIRADSSLPDTSPPPVAASASYSFAQNVLPPSSQDNKIGIDTGKSGVTNVVGQSNAQTFEEGLDDTFEDDLDDSFDIESCFQDFKSRIANVRGLAESEQSRLVGKAFHSCSPVHPKAWIYNVRAVRHLLEMGCNPIMVFRNIFVFMTPPLYTAESRDLLNCLNKAYSKFSASRRHYGKLYTKIARAASEARNSETLLQDAELLALVRHMWAWASLHPTKQDDFTDLVRVLADKLQNATIRSTLQACLAESANIKQIIVRLVESAPQADARHMIVERILLCLPRQQLRACATSVTSQLLQAVEAKTPSLNHVCKQLLRTWLGHLYYVDTKFGSGEPERPLLDLAIAQISTCFFRSNKPTLSNAELFLNSVVLSLRRHRSHKYLSIENMFEQSSHLELEGMDSQKVEEVLASIFALLKTARSPCIELLKTVAMLMAEHGGLGQTLQFLTAIENQNLTVGDSTTLERMIVDKMTAAQQVTSTSTLSQHQYAAFATRTCQLIFQVLGRISTFERGVPMVSEEDMTTAIATQQVRHFLDRAQVAHALPLEYRHASPEMSLQERVSLIHQLAYHYSLNGTRTHLENWRSVYYLFCHLRQHDLPIGSLFTRAVVRVSIIRPLIERRYVSARRVIWVCQLVARVEGDSVARKVESDFWYWRGSLIAHAKERFVRAGGHSGDKAHIGSMKRLMLI